MPNTVSGKGLGWRRSVPDFRDWKYAAPGSVLKALPPAVDLRPQMPVPVWDQGPVGSCTSHAVCAAFCFAMAHVQTPSQVPPAFDPSRLFHYWLEREAEGTTASDGGAELRTGLKVIGAQGVCPTADWPYVPGNLAVKPPDAAYQDAVKHEATRYLAVSQTASEMKGCLADGFPFVAGAALYTSFMSDAVAKSGIVPMPASTEAMVGGHAFLVVGFRDDQQVWLCRNSWSTSWGDTGHFTLPFQYLLSPDLSSDFWAIRATS